MSRKHTRAKEQVLGKPVNHRFFSEIPMLSATQFGYFTG